MDGETVYMHILSVVVVITGVLHVDPVNPGTHSTPTFTFTSMSVICIESESASVPSGKSVSSGINLAVPSTPFLGALINTPILGFVARYSGSRLSAPGPRFSV